MPMASELQTTTLSWDPVHDLSEILEYHFMINALAAGTIVAVAAGVAGWLMLLRREAFAGHTLSLMAFPGAAAAALVGVSAGLGYYGACAAGALAIAWLASRPGRSGRDGRSVAIAAVQSVALACGFLFVSLYGGILGDLENLLFGTFLGVSDGRLLALGLLSAGLLAALAVIARPLLFASVQADVAAARGVPVRALGAAFLLALGLAVAAAAQITGALLVFALLVGPPASAQAITARPLPSLALTVAIGLLVAWLGLGISYFSTLPPGFWIAMVSFAAYALARLAVAAGRARTAPYAQQAPPPGSAPAPEGVIA
jgi:zinc/manganese transport system permease protein